MWQTPKTDWQESDFFNVEDYNRIKGNLNLLLCTGITLAASDISCSSLSLIYKIQPYHIFVYTLIICPHVNRFGHLKNDAVNGRIPYG